MSGVFPEGDKPLDRGSPDQAFTQRDREVMETLRKVMLLPNEFKDYLVQYMALNQPPIPIGQIFGFTQFVAQTATPVVGTSTTTSTTYGDLADGGGPSLTGLADGRYLFLFGCSASNSATANSHMSLKVNTTEADDADGCVAQIASNFVGISRAVVKDLDAGGNNTVTTRYRVSSGTGSFTVRWLVAIRYANL